MIPTLMRSRASGVIGAAMAFMIVLVAPPIAARPVHVRHLQAIPNGDPLGKCGAPHDEVWAHIAVNPIDEGRMLAAWMQDSYQAVAVARSTDGGASWSMAPIDGIDACGVEAFAEEPDFYFEQPWLTYGLDRGGRAVGYLTLVALDLKGDQAIVVSTTHDDGETWSVPRVVSPPGESKGKPAIFSRPTEPCSAFVVWAGYFRLQLARTFDCGATWTQEDTLYAVAPTDVGARPHGSLILVLPDDVLLHVFLELDQAGFLVSPPTGPVPVPILVQRSEDDGDTWSDPVEIGRSARTVLVDPDGNRVGGMFPYPTAAVAPDGRAYVAWPDYEGRIVLSVSADAGWTWSTPATIATEEKGAFLPTLAVGPDGTVGVTYYDFASDERGDDELTTQVWFIHADGGRTAAWEKVRVAEDFDLGRGFVGNYQGLAALRGGFAATFVMTLDEDGGGEGSTDAFFAEFDLPGGVGGQVHGAEGP